MFSFTSPHRHSCSVCTIPPQVAAARIAQELLDFATGRRRVAAKYNGKTVAILQITDAVYASDTPTAIIVEKKVFQVWFDLNVRSPVLSPLKHLVASRRSPARFRSLTEWSLFLFCSQFLPQTHRLRASINTLQTATHARAKLPRFPPCRTTRPSSGARVWPPRRPPVQLPTCKR